MIVRLYPESPVPIFEQLRSQLERLIVSGQLGPGTQLPTIRHLATDLGIAKGTVAKVYETLVRDGLVTTERRHGTTVAARPEPAPDFDPAKAPTLVQAAELLAVTAKQLGGNLEIAQETLSRAWNGLENL
jgi:DNA-binding transcriptional regulator YhcF (GntR family)